METLIIDYGNHIRIAIFLTAFIGLSWWETYFCWRPWLQNRKLRIARHLSLSLISKALLRIALPIISVDAAFQIQAREIGLFHKVQAPFALQVILGVIFLDFVIFLQHRWMHKWKILWRLHKVHHIDTHLDVSTGVRFHPLEELVSMVIKVMGIAFLGVVPLAVIIFEVLLNFFALFTHLNVKFKKSTETKLRWLLVTPGMHRIHHSDMHEEQNKNFGFCLNIWDKLFGCYLDECHATERKLVVGLEGYRDTKFQTLLNMLLLPFGLKHLRIKPAKLPKTKMDNGG